MCYTTQLLQLTIKYCGLKILLKDLMFSVIIIEKNGTQKTFGGDGYVYLNRGDVP